MQRAVVHAARTTRSPAAVELFISALDDDDRLVQYEAVMGLAESIGPLAGAPSVPAFLEEPQRYIGLWKERARQR